MGTKTKTVGGGQATGTANAFNNWMLNGLQTGNFGSSPSGVDQAAGQTNNFGNAVNSMLSGNGNQNNYNQWFDALKNINAPANMAGAPSFRETNFTPLNTDAIKYKDVNDAMFGANGSVPGYITNAGQMSSMFGGGGPVFGSAASVNFDPNQIARIGNVINPADTKMLNVDYANNPEMQALTDLQNRNKAMDVANLRARFGQTGTGLGSGAAFAEGQYLAQANPQNTLALGELGRQMQALDMQNRGQNMNAYLNQKGLDVNQRSTDVNAALQAAVTNANNATNASMQNASMANSYGMNLAGLAAQWNQARMQGQLSALGQDNSNIYNNANYVNNAIQGNNQNLFNNNNAFNAFNQSNYQFGQNNNLAQAQAQANLGLGLMNQGSQSQNAMMQMLMSQFGNINQLGTPQAQTVQVANPWMQGAQALGGLASGLGSLATGGGLGAVMSGLGGMFGSRAPSFGQNQYMTNNATGYNPNFSPTGAAGWNTFNPSSGYQFGSGAVPRLGLRAPYEPGVM